MADEKKDQELEVKIYKETPGNNLKNAEQVDVKKEVSKEAEEEALKKLSAEKEEDKKNEQLQNDTSGEDG
jgi:hypothetical protein